MAALEGEGGGGRGGGEGEGRGGEGRGGEGRGGGGGRGRKTGGRGWKERGDGEERGKGGRWRVSKRREGERDKETERESYLEECNVIYNEPTLQNRLLVALRWYTFSVRMNTSTAMQKLFSDPAHSI